MVALTRMYLGLHYPTDILGGALVGVAISWLGNTYLPGARITRSIQELSWGRPMYFYPALFLLTYQIADLFENSRELVGGVFKLGKVLLAHTGPG
ncbi:MAG: phosphatase PAP2 family protein [Ramlibacter sp.]